MGIGLAIGALAAGIGAGTTVTAGVISLGFSFAAAATSFALGALQSLLTPRPSSANLSSGLASRADGVTQNIRQAITARRILYGEARVGGALTFIETTGDDEFLHMVIVVADHKIAGFGEVWFDDNSIPPDYIDPDGTVNAGTFSGRVRIKFHLGEDAQVADPDLVAETSVDSTFRGRGVAYMYLRLQYNRDTFPSSIPTVTVFAKGKETFDPRDDQVKYLPNSALIANDYLVEPIDSFTPGVGALQSNVDENSLISAANTCDEFVLTEAINHTILSASNNIITLDGINDGLSFQTADRVVLLGSSLPGGLSTGVDYYVIPYQRRDSIRVQLASSVQNAYDGVAVDISSTGTGVIRKTAEPRYVSGGVIETSQTPEQNLTDLLSALGGSALYIGGAWNILAAAPRTPEPFVFDESHIISSVVLRTKVSRRDRFNLVKGVYVSPLNQGQPSDYPPVTNQLYVNADGGTTLPIDHDLPMTQRPHTGQRLAKIRLEKHRQELFFEAEYSLHAMQVKPGDIIKQNFTRFGWDEKLFEVLTWRLDTRSVNGVPLFFVKMSLQETATTVYDWNMGEETRVDPAPNTSLPNPLQVAPPTGLAVVPVEIRTAAGDLTYEFIVSWSPPNDIFVVNGGHFDVQFKRTSATEWSRSFRAEDEDTEITVKQVEPGVNYDVRIRSVNDIGVRSVYQSLFGFTVDSPSGATIRTDDGSITGPVLDTEDQLGITDSVESTIDEGDIS